MVPHFFRTLLQRSAKLSVWTLVTEAEVEMLRCGYAARCSRAGCRQYGATTIVRYLDYRGRPLRQLVEVCDEHADLIKLEQRRLNVRDPERLLVRIPHLANKLDRLG
jgi:hypothetical protein